MPHKYSRTGKSSAVFSLQAKLSEAGRGAGVLPAAGAARCTR